VENGKKDASIYLLTREWEQKGHLGLFVTFSILTMSLQGPTPDLLFEVQASILPTSLFYIFFILLNRI
jgi:hypothetical protein